MAKMRVRGYLRAVGVGIKERRWEEIGWWKEVGRVGGDSRRGGQVGREWLDEGRGRAGVWEGAIRGSGDYGGGG